MRDTAARDLLDLSGVATLTTLMATGAPQSTIMWYRRVDDVLRMIAPASAVKARNIERDSRVSVVVTHPENPYHYLEVRGNALVVRDDSGAREELRHIARRYIGERADAYAGRLSSAERVIIEIPLQRVRMHVGQRPD